MPFFFPFDPLYLLFIAPALLLALFAQAKVKSSFARWSRVASSSGLSGAQAAAMMLRHAGVTGVTIERTGGYLSDHYDPSVKVLRLSPDVHDGISVAALGVACHEAGHAVQDAAGYPFLRFRSHIVPLAKFGSWISWPLIIGGLLLSWKPLAAAGLIAFGALVLFQILTLPVELDASRRAKQNLREMGLFGSQEEDHGVVSVLAAAALTYVAATIQSIAQLLYYLYILGFLGGRRNSAA